MNRRFFNRTGAGILVGLGGLFATAAARSETAKQEPTLKTHRMAFQVSSGDTQLMTLVLGNATNAADYYKARNETVQIEIVAFGPGYLMLRDISPVKERISEMRKKLPSIVFSACQNSRAAIARQDNKTPADIHQLPEAVDVAAGVVRLSELQEDGWSYIRT